MGERDMFDLKMAAVGIDRASVIREAPDVWRSLIAGEWRVVEVFDSDGRRFMVARRSPSETAHPLLTAREEHVLALRARAQGIKQIAYELGLSESTVSRELSRGMRKLGLTTAGELSRFTCKE